MKHFVILSFFFFLTGCLDLAVQSVQRLSDEVGGTQGVVDVTGDNLVKAEEVARWAYAANGGDAEAQYNMGKALCCGKRPYYNTYDALQWFCKSAKQGQRDAIFEVARIYENAYLEEGSVIPQDDVLAYVYYIKALEHGNKKAAEDKMRVASILNVNDRKKAQKILNKWPDIQCEVNN